MKMEEFETVDLLLGSDCKTKTTDAFILSYAKFEKQMRRLAFYLMRQEGVPQTLLRDFSARSKLTWGTCMKYFNNLHSRTFYNVLDAHIGLEERRINWKKIEQCQKNRNKIIHGLLTGKDLPAKDLKTQIDNLQHWCQTVGEAMHKAIGFDGLHKTPSPKKAHGAHRFTGKTVEELNHWLNSLPRRR